MNLNTNQRLPPRAFSIVLRDAEDILITREDALVVKAIREGSREVDFVASTDVVDAHREVIDQESWNLDHYAKNPVALYGHQSYELPIGHATKVGIVNGRLECTLYISDKTAKAREVWDLLVEKTLRAVSVGFKPVNGRYETRDGVEDIWVWSDCILKEISVVAVPANHEALAKIKSAMKAAPKKTPTDSLAGVPASDTATETKAGTHADERNDIMKTAEQLAKELEDANKAHAETSKRLGESNVKALEAEQRAEKAEARATVAEKSLADVTEQVKKLQKEATTRETEHTKAVEERDAQKKRADELETKFIDAEVEALVGVKIAKAEKEEFVELRKTNEKLFKSMVEKRADMKLLERVTQDDPKATPKDVTPKAPSATNGIESAVDAFKSL